MGGQRVQFAGQNGPAGDPGFGRLRQRRGGGDDLGPVVRQRGKGLVLRRKRPGGQHRVADLQGDQRQRRVGRVAGRLRLHRLVERVDPLRHRIGAGAQSGDLLLDADRSGGGGGGLFSSA